MLASEGSDWAKVGSEASDWPSAVPLPPSSTGTNEPPGHKLESVLEKLGFSEYLSLFQVCTVDREIFVNKNFSLTTFSDKN